MKELKDLFKNSFGSEKDSRSHAIAMLIIYGIFITIVIVAVREAPIKEKAEPQNNSHKQEIIDNKGENEEKNSITKNKDFDINYSYSYTVIFDGKTEVYLGKKIDDKEKFSYIKDNITTEYAILNDNYLILENGTYHITEQLNNYFKYCDAEKITNLLEDIEYIKDGNKYIYNIDSTKLAYVFDETLKASNSSNRIELEISGDNLKSISLNLNNYISSVLGDNHTLSIKMEFANVGTTEDFDIKLD